MESLSCRVRSSFPEQGVTSHNSYTLQRCVALLIRDQSLVAQPGDLSRPYTLVWGPVIDSNQSLPFSVTPHAHPFVSWLVPGRHLPNTRLYPRPDSYNPSWTPGTGGNSGVPAMLPHPRGMAAPARYIR
jgi:hypothetical protein